MILLSLMVQSVSVEAGVAVYRERTRADVACRAPSDSDEVIVCGRRDADKYRVPFLVYEAGDRRHLGVPAERNALIHDQTPCESRGPFLIGCGAVGVGASTRFGGAGAGPVSFGTQMRPLAP